MTAFVMFAGPSHAADYRLASQNADTGRGNDTQT